MSAISSRPSEVRELLRKRSGDQEFGPYRLAELFHEVLSNEYYREWGYRAFSTYVTKESGRTQKSVENLIFVHQKLRVELKAPLPELKAIGFAKASIIAPLAKSESVAEWLSKAQVLTYSELKKLSQDSGAVVRAKALSEPAPTVRRTQRTAPKGMSLDRWRTLRPSPSDFFVSEENWDALWFGFQSEVPVLISGPSGCGKTGLVGVFGRALGVNVERFNFGAMSDPRGALLGNLHLEAGETRFISSRFVRAFEKGKQIILLDELNRASKDALNIMLPVLDGQGYLAMDDDPGTPQIKRGKGILFVATVNLGFEYTGTESLDRAVEDRFGVFLEMHFPPPDAETAILRMAAPSVAEKSLSQLVQIANQQRRLALDQSFSRSISTRTLIVASKFMASGFTIEQAIRSCILRRFSTQGAGSSETELFGQILQKMGIEL